MERSMVKLSLWGSKCNIGTYEFTIKKKRQTRGTCDGTIKEKSFSSYRLTGNQVTIFNNENLGKNNEKTKI